ncbi:hemerythrin [Desulfuromonas versatilis]|uniref:Hemerythrin n=1 Tax=Desulfuromonas versatilis TaxID=2802975 RepID=A0ABN6DZE7_9BACT|nr:hemerythrin family protein [Desulfuromonas versatilis]BCR05427.1 hemerythrin [Desulfuromonas versatilis]
MNIYWTAELATGMELIDQQHRELFARIDRLVGACMAGKGREETGPMLEFMENYMEEHFAAEERLMADSDYPRAEFHVQEHALFRERLEVFKRELADKGSEADLLTAVNQSIVDWLFDHVCIEDRDLGAHLRAQQR